MEKYLDSNAALGHGAGDSPRSYLEGLHRRRLEDNIAALEDALASDSEVEIDLSAFGGIAYYRREQVAL